MNAVSLVDRPTLHRPQMQKQRAEARWLVTFADLAAVMVAFFVLLFAMAEVDSDKWEGTTIAFDRQFRIEEDVVTPRPVEEANITQKVAEPALDLRYIERLANETLKEHEVLRDVRAVVSADRLVFDFPGELLFANGRVGVSVDGRQSLFILGGMLAGVDNQVAIVGHAAPQEVAEEGVLIDWEQSLVRAARVARSMVSAGYDRPVKLQGRSGSRFGGPAPTPTEAAGAVRNGRIEIIVQNEMGDRR